MAFFTELKNNISAAKSTTAVKKETKTITKTPLKASQSAATQKYVSSSENSGAASGAANASVASGGGSTAVATSSSAESGIVANAADIVSWNGITFFVKPTVVKGVKDISIKSSPDTEDTEGDGEQYTTRKNMGGFEITMTAVLNSMLGVNVEDSAKAILEAARRGDDGYFYIAGKKLFTPKFMMTDANASDIILTSDGRWASCEVQMTLKQCTKYDGTLAPPPAPAEESSSGGDSGGGGSDGGSDGGGGGGSSGGGSNVSSADARIHAVAEKVKYIACVAATNSAKSASQKVLEDSSRVSQTAATVVGLASKIASVTKALTK